MTRTLVPYGLQRIWLHPANREPGGLAALVRCLRRSGNWSAYQLRKQLAAWPACGRVISWGDGLQIRLLPASQASQACLYYGLPDWPSMQFLRRYLRPGDLCADIGANVGIYALLMARHAGPEHVHAFECLPANISRLNDNLALNRFESVSVHPVALADRDAPMRLNLSDADVTASISPPEAAEMDWPAENPLENDLSDGDWVQAKRLDGWSWPAPFDYIKIDVEGAEQLVLSGSERLLRSSPPLVWSLELLDTQKRLGSSKAALLEAFARWDYNFYLYRPEQHVLEPFRPDARGEMQCRQDDNVLAIHASGVDRVARRLAGFE